MHYSNQILIAVACVANIASGKPIDSRHTQPEPRGWIECPKGSWYMKCWNDPTIEGCFSKYPCDETAARPQPSAPAPEQAEDGGDDTKDEEETTVCTPGRARISGLYNLFPESKDKAEDSQSLFEIRHQDDQESLEQLAHFELPADAKECTLGWMMDTEDNRTFRVAGEGLFSTLQLEDAPDGAVSWNSVEALVKTTSAKAQRGDMTFWDQPEFNTARNHTIGKVDCGADIYMKLQLDTSAGQQGHVIMDQDETNGFFIDYKC